MSSCPDCYSEPCPVCFSSLSQGRDICEDCGIEAAQKAINVCKPPAPPSSNPAPPSSNPAPPSSNPVPPSPLPYTPIPTPCVSTAWLENNGHSEGIHLKGGESPVFCIPDFPCGTPGHIVRECNKENKCQLKTYAQICKDRGDCIENVEAVSQLKNSYDWSKVSRSACDLSGSLTLTSVSMNPNASKYSISSIIAHIGDSLNRNGYASITDALIHVPIYVRDGMNYARNIFSGSSSD